MGKLFDNYMEQYKAAIGNPPAGMLQVKPEAWILAKWETDNDTAPWMEDYQKKLNEAIFKDPDLGMALVAGIELLLDAIKKKEK